MIDKIISDGLTSYYDSFESWEDAVKASYQGMVKRGIVNEEYISEVIQSIKEFGPYVVITPKVAMPHTTVGSDNVFETAFSFMRVKEPVIFDPNDRSKDAHLFFSFAAQEENAHLKNIVELVEILVNNDFVEELFNVENDAQLEAVLKKYGKY